jgi:rubredoxin
MICFKCQHDFDETVDSVKCKSEKDLPHGEIRVTFYCPKCDAENILLVRAKNVVEVIT